MFSPRWLFLMPGLLVVALGLVGCALALGGVNIGRATLDAHTLLFSCLAVMLGYQAIVFALLTKLFAINEGFMPGDPRMSRFSELVTLERGLIAGGISMVIGGGLLFGAVLNGWTPPLAH